MDSGNFGTHEEVTMSIENAKMLGHPRSYLTPTWFNE